MKERAVAIKVEPVVKKDDKINDPRRLVLEQNVLVALRNKVSCSLFCPCRSTTLITFAEVMRQR